jgi:hypothetical protein
MDEKCLENTNSKPGLTYRMIVLLPLLGVSYRRFPLPRPYLLHEKALESRNGSLRDGREVGLSTE